MAFGGWSRGRVLGRGSTATVSLATADRSGEQFAVKSAELAVSSFLRRERKILSSLGSCKNVVSYLGCDTAADGQYNIFLEYAPGGSLHDRIAERGGEPLAEAAVRSYARGIFAGLAFLHSERVVHCDIKSQNVLVGSDGQAKIADLGCAKFFEEEEGLQLRGTPMFMAPEVARGEGQGPEADVWAAGCVVVEMATGRAPWPEATGAMALLHRIAFSEDVPAAPGRMSEEGKDFLSKCLRREPGRRWTAEQLLEHPFLTNCSISDLTECSKWTSPKSVLDQSIWESLEVDDAAEPQRMLAELATSSSSGGPNWTWDEDWLAVRTDYEAAEPQQTVDDDDAATSSSGGGAEEYTTVAIDNAISSTATRHTDAEDPPSGYEGCRSVGGDDISCCCQTTIVTWLSCNIVNCSNEGELAIMLATFDWIFALIPVGSLLLSFALCSVVSCDPQKDPLLSHIHILVLKNAY